MVLTQIIVGAVLIGGVYVVATNRDKISEAVKTDEQRNKEEAERAAELERQEKGAAGNSIDFLFGEGASAGIGLAFDNFGRFITGQQARDAEIPADQQGAAEVARMNAQEINQSGLNPTNDKYLIDNRTDRNTVQGNRENEVLRSAAENQDRIEGMDNNPRSTDDVQGTPPQSLGGFFGQIGEAAASLFAPTGEKGAIIEETEINQGTPEQSPAVAPPLTRSRGRGVFG